MFASFFLALVILLFEAAVLVLVAAYSILRKCHFQAGPGSLF